MSSAIAYDSLREALTHGQFESFLAALVAAPLVSSATRRIGLVRVLLFSYAASYIAQPLSLIGHGHLSDRYFWLSKFALAILVAMVLMRLLPKVDSRVRAERKSARVERRTLRRQAAMERDAARRDSVPAAADTPPPSTPSAPQGQMVEPVSYDAFMARHFNDINFDATPA